MAELTWQQRVSRVTDRTLSLDWRRVLLSALFAPLALLGASVYYLVAGTVWTAGWVWFGLVEGWSWAKERPQPRHRK